MSKPYKALLLLNILATAFIAVCAYRDHKTVERQRAEMAEQRRQYFLQALLVGELDVKAARLCKSARLTAEEVGSLYDDVARLRKAFRGSDEFEARRSQRFWSEVSPMLAQDNGGAP
jgi:hypothetical protein